MERCPITGVPCSNPKIVHITDVGPGYTAENTYDLCQVCAMSKVQQKPKPEEKPIIKNLFDLLKLLITSKAQQVQQPVQPVEPPPPPPVPSCPGCGMTAQELVHAKKLGCPTCYDFYKRELLPVLIHAHKSTEHVGKKPKCNHSLPVEEQIKTLELQMKQAVEQEQYEKAQELKNRLAELKLSHSSES